MSKYLLFLFVVITVPALNAQNTDCKKWRNGIFMTYPVENKPVIISRKGNVQEETNTATGEVEKLEIHWVDECTYQISRKKKYCKGKNLHPGVTMVVQIMESYSTHCLVYIYSNVAGDIGYYDCMYYVDKKDAKLITP